MTDTINGFSPEEYIPATFSVLLDMEEDGEADSPAASALLAELEGILGLLAERSPHLAIHITRTLLPLRARVVAYEEAGGRVRHARRLFCDYLFDSRLPRRLARSFLADQAIDLSGFSRRTLALAACEMLRFRNPDIREYSIYFLAARSKLPAWNGRRYFVRNAPKAALIEHMHHLVNFNVTLETQP